MKRGRAWRGLSLSKGFPPLLFCRDRELGFLSTAVIWEEAASPKARLLPSERFTACCQPV